MKLFRCKHPFHALHVESDHTVEAMDEDFEHVKYHLYCRKCGKTLELSYAKMIGGVEEFIERRK